ncbi:uncharacterized protein LDX57_011914 [Aspergillus melleus]|uniref:uncharacterized protein n=1 Tax=Aspergillus melleus TaxID=138277 RepID=UPI001E8EABEF|nr:uncharacterized protein LDX57_011914 [Aspergillus melleus]KAH8434276.1 hypothetical protein LDX57_011914 [Aspergillus melleus]
MDRLEGATLFKLEGSTITVANEDFNLRTLFSEKMCDALGQRKAVFFGERISDQVPAAIKLRYQMNPRGVVSARQNPWVKDFAGTIFHREVDGLNDTSTISGIPGLLAQDTLEQTSSDEYPGGYLHVIVTQLMPGRPIEDYHNISASEGKQIEGKVVQILEDVRASGWCVTSGGQDDAIYGRNTMTVY